MREAFYFFFFRIILLTENNYCYYEIYETERILIDSIIISLAVKFHRILQKRHDGLVPIRLCKVDSLRVYLPTYRIKEAHSSRIFASTGIRKSLARIRGVSDFLSRAKYSAAFPLERNSLLRFDLIHFPVRASGILHAEAYPVQ